MPEKTEKNEIKNQKTYLDTFVFMDILSGDPSLASKAMQYISEAEKSGGVVSSILFTELAYHIRRRKSREMTEEILFYIESLPNLEIIPLSYIIAKHAGILRAKYRRLKTMKKLTYFDAIHIATAIESQCAKFVTGDKGFKDVGEINVEVY